MIALHLERQRETEQNRVVLDKYFGNTCFSQSHCHLDHCIAFFVGYKYILVNERINTLCHHISRL